MGPLAGDVEKMGKPKRIIHVDFAEKAVKTLPWLDERRFPLSEKRIKLRSKHWTPEIWEAYLHSLEVPQREPVGLKKDRAVILTEVTEIHGNGVRLVALVAVSRENSVIDSKHLRNFVRKRLLGKTFFNTDPANHCARFPKLLQTHRFFERSAMSTGKLGFPDV